MSKLSTADRKALPKSDFALPGKGEGPSGKGSGSYPIPDASHARNALARSANKSPEVKAAVARKVHDKFPAIGEHGMGERGGKKDGHTTSGLDHAMQKHADREHPVKRGY